MYMLFENNTSAGICTMRGGRRQIHFPRCGLSAVSVGEQVVAVRYAPVYLFRQYTHILEASVKQIIFRNS